MKALKYLLLASLSIVLILLLGNSTRPTRVRMANQDLEFDERAIC